VQFLVQLSRSQDDATWVYRELGAAEMRRGRWEDAVGYLLKAVKLRERDALSWENLGVCFFNVGRADSAKKALAKALALDPTRTYGNAVLAWAIPREAAPPEGAPRNDVELLSQAYRHFKDAVRHMFKGAVSTALESLAASGERAARCSRRLVAASKLLGDVAFLQLKLLGENGPDGLKGQARRCYAKAIHLAPNQACLYRNPCVEPPRLLEAPVAARCLEASLRIDGESSWGVVGAHSRSRYALIRALMLDKKNFLAWQALERVAGSEEERQYCHAQVKQLHREENDMWARVLASKMDPDASKSRSKSSSDLWSRMQVAELVGPELVRAYLADERANPMRPAVEELIGLLSDGLLKADRMPRADDRAGDAGVHRTEMERTYADPRKQRHEYPWKL
jgi:tetratricopeptide (TPR) repeat protein